MRRESYTLPLSLALLLFSCGGEAPTPDAPPQRDSAGVAIVEISAANWRDAPEWRLSPEPTLTIGIAEGEDAYQFFRITSVLTIDDGGIVVADNGSKQIRFFDRNGAFITSVGQEGDGPGDFRFLALLSRYGNDSLIAWDSALRRGTVLDVNGEFGRTFFAPYLSGPSSDFRLVPDGSLVGMVRPESPPDQANGITGNEARFVRVTPQGDTATIAELVRNESLRILFDGRQVSLAMPFDHRAVFAAAPWGLFYSTTHDFEIRLYGYDRRVARITRVDEMASPVTQEHIDTFIAGTQRWTQDPGMQKELLEMYSQAPFPETLPTYSDLLVAADSTLWALEYSLDSKEPGQWIVFGSDGRVLARVETPIGFQVQEVGSSSILGISRDSLGIERVNVYGLRKDEG